MVKDRDGDLVDVVMVESLTDWGMILKVLSELRVMTLRRRFVVGVGVGVGAGA